MKIVYHRRFEKQFKKLSVKLQEKCIERISLFAREPYHPTLRNHSLVGKLDGKRAFSVTGDVRIIFIEEDGYVVVTFLDVGTHSRLY